MPDWMEQQISNPDEIDEEAEAEKTQAATDDSDEERSSFERQLRTLLATNSVETLDTSVLEENIGDCDDIETLEKVAEIEDRDDALEIYESRLSELESEPSEVEEEEATDESESDGDGLSEEEETSSDPFNSPDPEPDESDSEPSEEPEEEMENNSEPEPEEKMENNSEPDPAGTPLDELAPDAVTVSEAAERERRWTIEAWSEPGLGKSHFSMSGPSPVCVIDTEGKADQLAHKFEDDGQFDDPFIFEPSNFDEALDSLNQAIDVLDYFRNEHDVVGTIVVDSISIMWEWAQQKYVEKFYPHADSVDEVELQTGFGSGKSDWKQIKNYHNTQFRQLMIDSPYHLIWTAMSEDDYDRQLSDGDRNAKKPSGENKNPYKVDEVIHLREGPDGAPMGELQKSGKVKHRYTGLRYPTFEKHKQVVEAIDEVEAGDRTAESVEARYDVRLVEGNPRYVKDEDE